MRSSRLLKCVPISRAMSGTILPLILASQVCIAQEGQKIPLFESHRWGERITDSKRLTGTADFLQNDSRSFGYPIKTICSIDFPVELQYDTKKFRIDDEYKIIGEDPKAVSSGLNTIEASKEHCSPDDYYRVKLCLLQKGARELQSDENITPNKPIFWSGLIGNSTVHLFSGCHRQEKGHFLMLKIEPVNTIR